MIGYVTLGTNDLARAAGFYDALFDVVGGKRAMETDRFVAWSVSPKAPALMIAKPFDGQPATAGNGTMAALVVDSKDQVERLHALALELGGHDEGPVGPRGAAGRYAAYFRDLDGNKLSVFCTGRD